MHLFFRIYDVLENFIRHVDMVDLPRVVGVCKEWYEIGMDVLWEKVDFRIFGCLGVLKRLSFRWNYLVCSFCTCEICSLTFYRNSPKSCLSWRTGLASKGTVVVFGSWVTIPLLDKLVLVPSPFVPFVVLSRMGHYSPMSDPCGLRTTAWIPYS